MPNQQSQATLKKGMIIILTFFALMVLVPMQSEGQMPVPRPLCASQFSLANYACARLPLRPVTPPSPPDDDDDDDGGNREDHEVHHHRHGHKSRHRHHSHHEQGPGEHDCCRWARQMDSQCVCEVLYLLPAFANFIMRPVHAISLSISDTCNVTYTCSGTIIR
jgi:hypothetical protein